MKRIAVILLCAAAFAAQATIFDYTVSKDPNGFNVYEVTKDTVKKVTGSPFGSSHTKFVWTDGTFIYAVNGVATPIGGPYSYEDAQIITYAVGSPPKQVAKLEDDSLGDGGCGHCNNTVHWATNSAQHAFLVMTSQDGCCITSYVHIYHTSKAGTLTLMCDILFPLGPQSWESIVTKIRTDANDFYAYVDYVDPTTTLPTTAIFDISTGACKRVGTLPQ